MTDRKCRGQILRPGNIKSALRKDREGREVYVKETQREMDRKKIEKAGNERTRERKGKSETSCFRCEKS